MKAPEESDGTEYEERSAITGRTMDEISSSADIWNSEKGKKESLKNQKKKPVAPNPMKDAEKSKFPGFMKPMLATLTQKAFSGEEWLFELKFDGYRVIAASNNREVSLYSRNGNDFTERFQLVADELSDINASFVIDGEVCFMENTQTMSFQKLQNKENEPDKIHFYVFDLLWLNGHNLTTFPLTERKKLLSLLLRNASEHIHYVDHIEKERESLYKEVEKKNQEGIIAKRAASKYYPGSRSDDWIKIKTDYRQEMIICGYSLYEKESR